MVPAAECLQNNPIFAQQKIVWKCVDGKGFQKGLIFVIHLGPSHTILFYEFGPFFGWITFINADDHDLGGIISCCKLLENRNRVATWRAPCAPEVQQYYFSIKTIDRDFLSR